MTPRQEITRELVRALQNCEDIDQVFEALRHCPLVEKLEIRGLSSGVAKAAITEKRKKTTTKAAASRVRTPVVQPSDLSRLSGGVPRKGGCRQFKDHPPTTVGATRKEQA